MLEKYLEFRFRTNNIKRYYERYFKEWVKGLTHNQLIYFEKEMFNLIKKGIYDPEK
jgi:hypothetical protein